MDLIVGLQTSTGNTSWATDNRYFTQLFSVDAANSTQLFLQLEWPAWGECGRMSRVFSDRLNWPKVTGLYRYRVLSAGCQKTPWSTAALTLLLLNPYRGGLGDGRMNQLLRWLCQFPLSTPHLSEEWKSCHWDKGQIQQCRQVLVSLLLKPDSNPFPLSVPPPKDFHLFKMIEISNHTWTDLPLSTDLTLVACTVFSVLMDQDTKVNIKLQTFSVKVTFKV